MTAAAYRYASREGELPPELDTLRLIDRFGVRAVLGRDVLSLGEMRRMLSAEVVLTAYRARSRAENWAKWADDNPELAGALGQAERTVADDEY